MNTLREVTTELLKNDIPDFNPGDTVSVDFRVVEGGKESLHSPLIASITVDRRGKVRRAKLNYLKKLTGKASRITEKR